MADFYAIQYCYLIPLLPLLGAAIAGFAGARGLKGRSHWPVWIGVGAAAVLSISILAHMLGLWRDGQTNLAVAVSWYDWINIGHGASTYFSANAGAYIDPLSAMMLCVVTGIGFFIIVFAAGYMKGEEGYWRFFAYLGMFIFAMTCLVMANNFVMLYLGWEGVGLCSYLLIGYYYQKPSAREAAKKAFLVNRIGDFGFGLGVMLIWKVFHTVSFFGNGGGGALNMATHPITADQINALKYIPFLLMLGAFGKSAQFPLYVWLPDAMEGPTPVSALIHAATMVTAGIYMIVRCGTMFVGNHAAMTTIAVIGAFTALLAATIALRQFDLKKVFAYSTVSQLGYMFVGVGVLAPVAGLFHLLTHAFFKALLFLSSGVVMHAMAGELDMRKMSGIKRVLPATRWLMLIGCLALAGFPFFSGFFSKDEIVGAALAQNHVLGGFMLFTAFLTAYYTFRLYFKVFEGPLVVPPPPEDAPHGHGADHAHAAPDKDAVPSSSHAHDSHGGHDGHHHNHEPSIMIIPLVVLAIGALLAGYLNWPKHGLADFLGNSPSLRLSYSMISAHGANAEGFGRTIEGAAEQPLFSGVMIFSGLLSIAGILLAWFFHLQNRAAGENLARTLSPITRILEAKYWVDEIYQALIVEPLRMLGRIFFFIDDIIVDGLVRVAGFFPWAGGTIVKVSMQRGYLQGYAASMLLGIALILLLIFMH